MSLSTLINIEVGQKKKPIIYTKVIFKHFSQKKRKEKEEVIFKHNLGMSFSKLINIEVIHAFMHVYIGIIYLFIKILRNSNEQKNYL